ncbi:MAG: 3-deoxy-manno-octulosonate cytidylyltransferase [Elusimicrobiales bacterium]|nr:3-deoxy-manno-octulosonate cytidylyltransferase [Elusimicrobiales bacterium]
MATDVLFVIPARYGSTRFPGKVLKPIAGKPVIQWIYEACAATGLGETLIATEDRRVVDAAAGFSAAAVLTSPDCASGTDRVYEAARNRKEPLVINVQGDEPFISENTLSAVVNLLRGDKETDIASACFEITDPSDITNPNSVKAVLGAGGRALYFSRSPVPYHHELSDLKDAVAWYKHCGIYGYRRAALEKFVKLPPCAPERLERLEQLRALEAGMVIKCAVLRGDSPAIDVPGDMERALAYLKAQGK